MSGFDASRHGGRKHTTPDRIPQASIGRTPTRGRNDKRQNSLQSSPALRGMKDSREATPKASPDLRRASTPISPPVGTRSFESLAMSRQNSRTSGLGLEIPSRDASRASKKRQSKKDNTPGATYKHFDGPIFRGMKGASSSAMLSYAQAAQSWAPQVQLRPRATIETQAAGTIQRLEAPSPRMLTPRTPPTPLRQESTEAGSDQDSSIFDADDNDSDRLSDFATDVSGSSFIDQGLPADLDPDDRLLNPLRYFRELEELEASVAANSGLFLMLDKNRQAYPNGSVFKLKFPFESHSAGGIISGSVSYDDAIMSFCRSQKGANPLSGQGLPYWAFHTLECRNLLLAVVSNLERMKNARYCTSFFSAISISSDRSNVARLVNIDVSSIHDLHQSFEHLIEDIKGTIDESKPTWTTQHDSQAQRITDKCRVLLENMGLPQGPQDVNKWRQAILVLDLAAVSYCGAHSERFDQRFLNQELNCAKITAAWTYVVDGSEGIMLRRRSLRCLDSFLGGRQAWVFQSQKLWADSSSLYLSTSMNDFADIWGPVWSVKSKEDSTGILRYNTGNGAILPWPSDKDASVADGEQFCHWSATPSQLSEAKGTIASDTCLLIGGSQLIEQKTSMMKENESCTNTTGTVISQLKATNLLDYLGTSADKKYLEEEQYGVGVAGYGVGIGHNRVYKRRAGVSLKDAICEAWKNGGGERNPAILEHWLGVEVSFCSRNARRRRLKSILASRTMRHWLESCIHHGETTPAVEKAFADALDSRNPRAFRDLYIQHREWRKELGTLLSHCLEGLRHSSLSPDDCTLRVLWMPQAEKKFRVKLKQATHSWTGLLADSETTCAFSIMSGKCLSTDYKYGGVCQHRADAKGHFGYPVLETAVIVNPSPNAPKPKMLAMRLSESASSGSSTGKLGRWSISRIPPDESFRLHRGRLKVIEPFRGTRLLVKWESGVAKMFNDAAHQMVRTVSKRAELHHWELMEEEDWEVKPIPLFVLSEFAQRR